MEHLLAPEESEFVLKLALYSQTKLRNVLRFGFVSLKLRKIRHELLIFLRCAILRAYGETGWTSEVLRSMQRSIGVARTEPSHSGIALRARQPQPSMIRVRGATVATPSLVLSFSWHRKLLDELLNITVIIFGRGSLVMSVLSRQSHC